MRSTGFRPQHQSPTVSLTAIQQLFPFLARVALSETSVFTLLLSAALAQNLQNTPIEALTLRFDTRYDNIDGGRSRHRLQNSALVAAQVDLALGIDLAVMAVTGDRFQSRWSTWRDLNGDEPERMSLSLRQLYLERTFGDFRVQIGSLSPVKGRVSTSGLEDLGWIDGGRVVYGKPEAVQIEAVLGSLTDPDEPDVFIRRRQLDYAEIEVSVALPHNVEAEVAGHLLQDGRYVKAEVGWVFTSADDRSFSVRAEGGIELRQGAFLGIIGARSDMGVLLTGNTDYADRLDLRLTLRHVDADYGLFGALSEDFYQFGTEFRVRANGDIDSNGIVSWNVRAIAPLSVDLLPRFDAGLSIRLKLSRERED
ncbi:MAG: hypothetical protein ACJATT_005293 [Myxococcota bacterium]